MKKKIFGLILAIALILPVTLVMTACDKNGGKRNPDNVKLSSQIVNSKGQIYFTGENKYNLVKDVGYGVNNADDLRCSFFVKPGYDISNIAITLESTTGSSSLDYTIGYWDAAVGREVTLAKTDRNDDFRGSKYGSYLQIYYQFPDAKHDYTVNIDANSCPGYGSNITLNIDSPVKVAKTNADFNTLEKNYYYYLPDTVFETPMALSASKQYYGEYGQKLLIFSEKKISLDSTTDLSEAYSGVVRLLQSFGSDWIYTIDEKSYYVYAIDYNTLDVTYCEKVYHDSCDFPNLMALKVVNRVENTNSGTSIYDHVNMMVYSHWQINNEVNEFYRPQNETSTNLDLYEIPYTSTGESSDVFYVYTKNPGSVETDPEFINDAELHQTLKNSLSAQDENLNWENYVKALQNKTLLIRLNDTTLKDKIQLYFERADGRAFNGGAKRIPVTLASANWKTFDCYQSGTKQNDRTETFYQLDLSSSALTSIFGTIPAGTVNLVMDVINSVEKIDVTINTEYSHDNGYAPTMALLDSSEAKVSGAVMYYNTTDSRHISSAIRSSVAGIKKLQFAFPENVGDRPTYQSITCVVTGDNGQVLNVAPVPSRGAIEGISRNYYLTFNAVDTATLLAQSRLTFDFKYNEKVTTSINIGPMTLPAEVADKIEFATLFMDGRISNWAPLGQTIDINLKSDQGQNVKIYRIKGYPVDWEHGEEMVNLLNLKVFMTYDDAAGENGRNSRVIGGFTQVIDLFDQTDQRDSNCHYLQFTLDNYDNYANRSYALVYTAA